MLKLNKEDSEKLNYDSKMHIARANLSIGSFYVKSCSWLDMLNELLGKKVADMVGIKCPNYYIVKDKKYIMSDNLEQKDNFVLAQDIGVMTNSTYSDVCELLDTFNENVSNIPKVKKDFMIMHFIDILFSNADRNVRNYGFCKKDDELSLVIFDNSAFLENFHISTRPLAFEKVKDLDYVFHSKDEEAKSFFEKLSFNDIEILKKIYELFSPNRVKYIISSIEEEEDLEYPLKRKVMRSYKKNYSMIKKLFNDLEKTNDSKKSRR